MEKIKKVVKQVVSYQTNVKFTNVKSFSIFYNTQNTLIEHTPCTNVFSITISQC